MKSFDSGSSGLLGLLCMLALLVSIYHQYYDALMLIVPSSAMILRPTGDWQHVHVRHRAALLILINTPLLNYLSARLILNQLGQSPGMPASTNRAPRAPSMAPRGLPNPLHLDIDRSLGRLVPVAPPQRTGTLFQDATWRHPKRRR